MAELDLWTFMFAGIGHVCRDWGIRGTHRSAAPALIRSAKKQMASLPQFLGGPPFTGGALTAHVERAQFDTNRRVAFNGDRVTAELERQLVGAGIAPM